MTASVPAKIFGIAAVIATSAALGAFAESHRHSSESVALMSATDVTFTHMMMNHHQQAVAICDLLSPQAPPEIRTLAEQIKQTQLAEVGTMVGWLQIADQALNPSHREMGDHTSTTGPSMGMATREELSQLQRATSRDNEALFLQLMTRHHQGGTEMAIDESRNGSNAAIRSTALAMANEQGQEIRLMQRLMTKMNATPLPFP
jgi:uncharacterized protein (DUF305 family)